MANTIHSDKELFEQISEGNEKAFKNWYIQLKPMLFGFIFKLTKSEDAVREIVQESLFRLWMSRDKLPEVQHPRTWFFKLVSNECYRYFRKHGLQKRLTEELSGYAANTKNAEFTEMEISFRETRRLIQTAVETLSPRQRQIFQLSRNNGLRIPEIAAQMGLSENYVKKTLMLALSKIRKVLIDAGKYLPLLLIWLIN